LDKLTWRSGLILRAENLWYHLSRTLKNTYHHHRQNFEPQSPTEDPAWLHPVFTFLSRNGNFLQGKVISVASNLPTWKNRHLYLFSHWQDGPVIPPDTAFPFTSLMTRKGYGWGNLTHWYPNLFVCVPPDVISL
jgi:hypothetical protein